MSAERDIVESLIARSEMIEAPDDSPQYFSANLAEYSADSLSALLKEPQPLVWTVEHWLEAGTLALLVGAEGSFKSFLAVDWAMSIVIGRDWHGCRVKPGRVLYVAGEGRTGVIRRMRGWCYRHQIDGTDDLLLGRSPIELVTPDDAMRIAMLGKFELVVIDTLARNFGAGNENDQKDMGAAIANADRIRQSTGATVLLVHHAPLEGREEGKLRPRGSSTLPGAADAIFTCSYDKESKVITVASTKQKDAASPEPLFLSFDVVELGDQDNFGNEITTVVLCQTHKRPVSKKTLGKNQKLLVQTVRSMMNGHGDGEFLVNVLALQDRLADAMPQKQRRSEAIKWLGEQSWARMTVGGYFVDPECMPRG